jgi:hypothetical protein
MRSLGGRRQSAFNQQRGRLMEIKHDRAPLPTGQQSGPTEIAVFWWLAAVGTIRDIGIGGIYRPLCVWLFPAGDSHPGRHWRGHHRAADGDGISRPETSEAKIEQGRRPEPGRIAPPRL